jgi:DNA-binding NarL/FixJ family response regulator
MTSPQKITLLLAEDHVVVREGLHALLQMNERFSVVGEARTGREAREMARTLQPDVVLMDIAMPTLNGLEAARQILAANPVAKVIVLSAHSDEAYVERMLEVGVTGFLAKQASIETLNRAICEVASGRSFFSPAIARRRKQHTRNLNRRSDRGGKRLTSRETEILQLVAEGMANKQIAGELGISIKTVEKHRQHLMDKLNIHDTARLTRYAISACVIESSVQLTII